MLSSPAPFLRIEGVSKTFGTFQAVRDVSLTIEKGEIFALLGGSGCGCWRGSKPPAQAASSSMGKT
jgi:putrescine transport system ATP-binding protein